MTKKILKDFILTEISGVDRPAQPTAKMTIIKRDENVDVPPADLAKGEVGRFPKDPVDSPDVLKTQSASGKEGDDMSELDDLKKQVSDLTKKLEDSEVIAKMSDEEKMYMLKMSDEDKKSFMALSEEERKKKMAMHKRDDETIEVAGQTISKSAVGDQMFTIMKAQQAQLKANEDAIRKAQDEAEMATLSKRADDEFGHVPGTTAERAALLKAAKAMPESVQKTLEQVLKSYEATIAKAFESQGHSYVTDPVMKSASEQLDGLVKKYQDQHKVSAEAAYSAVIDQNPKLYEQMIGEGN